MIKGKDLLGLSVVGQSDGTQLGSVRDLIFDHDTDQLLAFVISEKDLFGLIDAQIVAWQEVLSIGSEVILVASAASKTRLNDDKQIEKLAQRETSLSGTQIMTSDGRHLGTLADTLLDEQSGRVLGFEVSGGFIADSLKGKKFLPAPPGLHIGKDVAVAQTDAVDDMKQLK